MKPIPSPRDQGWNEEIIKILKRLGALEAEYPAELFAARRAAFILRVEQQDKSKAENGLFSNGQFLRHLQNLKTVKAEYPAELLAARRAAFVDQVESYRRVQSAEDQHSEDQEIIRLCKRLKSVEAEYPPNLMAARRAAFKRQLALGGRVSVLEALRASVRNLLPYKLQMPSMPTMNTVRTSLVVIGLMLAAFMGSLLRNPVQSLNPSSTQGGFSQPGHGLAATSTSAVVQVICKPGYLPPLCLAGEFEESQDLTYQGNGSARPAVAKDTLPGYHGVHKAAYVNDGLYGPGASWVSNSAYSWVKIDLGKSTTINMVAFGRDRLGKFNDRDPGQFVIAVALSDNAYADGNSSNDYVEYTEVYNSEQIGFTGIVLGPETIRAQFGPVTVRFIKITFANPGTAVDEVEAFLIQPPVLANDPTKKPKEDPPGIASTSASASTVMPTNTAIPVPTNTPVPADTATPVPTDTPAPTNTAIPAPTNTPIPVPTNTPAPANTPIPVFTDTPMPPPPPTDPPQPTDTSISSANMVEPAAVPTETPIPVAP